MQTFFVVTGIVLNPDKKILLLKKSMDDYNYPGKWSFCSGFVKEHEAGEETVLREITEETGLSGKIISDGNILEVVDKEGDKKWVIACYLCSVESSDVKLCHENTEYAWVDATNVDEYDTVPGLVKDLKVMGLK